MNQFLLLLPLFLIAATLSTDVENNVVVFDDIHATLVAPLVVSGSGYAPYSITPKSYTGDINIVFRFDKDSVMPYRVLVPSSRTVSTSYTCPVGMTATDDGGVAECFYVDGNGSRVDVFSVSYDRIHYPSRTAFVDAQESFLRDVTGYFSSVRSSSVYGGDSVFYLAENVPVVAGEELLFYTFVRSPIVASEKYDLAFYPSSYGVSAQGLRSANQDGVLYVLDPFINSTYYDAVFSSDVAAGTSAHYNASLSSLNYTDLSTGLDRYYDASEAAYTSQWSDLSGNGFVADRSGTFTDDGDYWDLTGANTWFNTSGTIIQRESMSALVDIDAIADQPQIISDSGAGGNMKMQVLNTGAVICRFFDGSERTHTSSAGVVANDVLTHIVCTYDTGNVSLYINGSFHSSTATGGGALGAAQGAFKPHIGTYANNPTAADLNGQLYSVAVWDRTLSPSDVAALYALDNNPLSVLYNVSRNTFVSDAFDIGINATSINFGFVRSGTGNISFSLTCDADAGAPSYSVVTANGSVSCPVDGDKFQYNISFEGTPSASPVVENITAHFIPVAAPAASNLFSINASDVDNSSAILVFSAFLRANSTGSYTHSFSTTNGSIVTNISNADPDTWGLYVNASQRVGQVINNVAVSNNITVNLTYNYPNFVIASVVNVNDSSAITSFNYTFAQGASVFTGSSTNGTATVSGVDVVDGLFNISVDATGYYTRTYSNYNVSLTGLNVSLYPSVVGSGGSVGVSDPARTEFGILAFFLVLFIVVGYFAFRASSVVGATVAFLGVLYILFEAGSASVLTNLSDYSSFLVVPIALVVFVVFALAVFSSR